MLSGKKSDLKNHLSAKHPTWAHKVMAKPAHERPGEMERQKGPSPEGDPPPKAQGPEIAHLQS